MNLASIATCILAFALSRMPSGLHLYGGWFYFCGSIERGPAKRFVAWKSGVQKVKHRRSNACALIVLTVRPEDRPDRRIRERKEMEDSLTTVSMRRDQAQNRLSHARFNPLQDSLVLLDSKPS